MSNKLVLYDYLSNFLRELREELLLSSSFAYFLPQCLEQ
jgi:hypothetical protein